MPFGRDPNSSVLRRDVESDRLIGNVSVTYVTLVPWRGTETSRPSPRLLYHRWRPVPARLLSENLNMRCTCCLFMLTLSSAAAGCNNRMPMCIGSFSLHSKWIGPLSDIPIRRSSDVTSPFPPSGNEGYIRNRDVLSIYFLLDSSHVIGWAILLAALISFSETIWEFPWLCLGSLSCWNVHPHFIFIILVDGSRFFSRMSLYIFPFILPLIIWIFPMPHHDVLGWCAVPFELHTWCVLWHPNIQFLSHLTKLYSPSISQACLKVV